jgi:hypothetical protein
MHGDLALAQKTKPMGKSQNQRIHFAIFAINHPQQFDQTPKLLLVQDYQMTSKYG